MTEIHRFWRAPVSEGAIAAGAVDRTAGEAGVIRGFSVVEAGEARGHGQVIDGTTLAKVVELGNGVAQGVKMRFGHPNMSGDAFGTFAGRAKKFRLQGSKVIADAFFSDVADEFKRNHVFGLAERDRTAIGTSLDLNMTLEKRLNDDGTPQLDPEGEPLLPLVRPTKLNGSDFVDTPAATSGLFSGTSVLLSAEFTQHLDRFLSKPDALERADAFWQRYKQNRKSEDDMEEQPDVAAEVAEEKTIRQRVLSALGMSGSEPADGPPRGRPEPPPRPPILTQRPSSLPTGSPVPPILVKPLALASTGSRAALDTTQDDPGIRELMAQQSSLIGALTEQVADMRAEQKASKEATQASVLSALTSRVNALVPVTQLSAAGSEGVVKTVKAMLDAGAGAVAATAIVDSLASSLPPIEVQAKLAEEITFRPNGSGAAQTTKVDLRPFGVREGEGGKYVPSNAPLAMHLALKMAPHEGDLNAQLQILKEEWVPPGAPEGKGLPIPDAVAFGLPTPDEQGDAS